MYNIHVQCHGNYIEVEKFNYRLEIDILRNCSLKDLGVLRDMLWGKDNALKYIYFMNLLSHFYIAVSLHCNPHHVMSIAGRLSRTIVSCVFY